MDVHKYLILLVCFLFLIHNFGLANCSFKDTITTNQIFQDGDLLISKDNKFALGFFSPASSKYRYLGIWFHKVSLPTVVWVANRNNPINGSSGLLSFDPFTNNLILYSNHSRKVSVWSTNIVSVEVSQTDFTAQILDSGNLVLVQNNSGRIVWQSFDYPSDTLLEGMKVGVELETGIQRSLSSWKSLDNPASGDYSVRVNPKGSPQLFYYKGTNPYWRSIPWPLRNYVDIINYSFVYSEEEISISYRVSDSSATVRAYMDHSGFNRFQLWHEKQGIWMDFCAAPKYQCDTYGHCGSNSKCDPNQFNRRFECDCLPGFEPKYPSVWRNLRDSSGGCVRKRNESSLLCGNGEGFVKVANVKLPDTSVAVWLGMNLSPVDCQNRCLANCSCSAYASIDMVGERTGCLAWYGELIDTVISVDEGYDLYVRVDATELADPSPKGLQVETILLVSVFSTWLVVCFLYLWLRKKRKRVNRTLLKAISRSDTSKDALVGNHESKNHVDVALFSLRILVAATNNFSPANKLGQGGFGIVYKGKLSNGLEIAVKRLSQNSDHGIEEFINEVTLIAKLQHQNLVKLLGCCIEGEEPMIIYEYMPNRSLDSLLFPTRKMCLDWRTRFDIIIGVARGIAYLHHDSRLKIIHRDLKSSNILLDREMNPKISDFGMARVFEGGQIQERTKRIVGTYGYMPPEYAAFGKFSVKSDVFSYGVILLEIISGEKNNGYIHECSLSLIDHVWQLWKEDRAMEIVDSSIKECCDSDQALRCIQIGLLCVQENATDRPNMLDVVVMLNSNTSLPYPNQPAYILRDVCNGFSSPGREGSFSKNGLTITKSIGR